jgi:hypothetical protein
MTDRDEAKSLEASVQRRRFIRSENLHMNRENFIHIAKTIVEAGQSDHPIDGGVRVVIDVEKMAGDAYAAAGGQFDVAVFEVVALPDHLSDNVGLVVEWSRETVRAIAQSAATGNRVDHAALLRRLTKKLAASLKALHATAGRKSKIVRDLMILDYRDARRAELKGRWRDWQARAARDTRKHFGLTESQFTNAIKRARRYRRENTPVGS